MALVFGEGREMAIARELTKTYESFYHGTAGQLLEVLREDANARRGEFVVMVRGARDVEPGGDLDVDRLLALLLPELPVKKAAKIVAEVSGVSRNELYQRALALRQER